MNSVTYPTPYTPIIDTDQKQFLLIIKESPFDHSTITFTSHKTCTVSSLLFKGRSFTSMFAAEKSVDTTTTTSTTSRELRIACLEPSATAICLELGLEQYLVGVTHECGGILDRHYSLEDCTDDDGNINRPLVMTKNGLTVNSQADIHLAIQKTAAAVAAATQGISCPIRNNNNNDILPPPSTDIPSLYPLIEDNMLSARPTVIFTQDLCDVCAPNTAAVRRCLLKNSSSEELDTIVSVIALQPHTLHEVTDTVS